MITCMYANRKKDWNMEKNLPTSHCKWGCPRQGFSHTLPLSHSPPKQATSVPFILAAGSFSIARLIFVKVGHCHEMVTLKCYSGKYKPDAPVSSHTRSSTTSQGLETALCLCAQPAEQLGSVTLNRLEKLNVHCKVRLHYAQRKQRGPLPELCAFQPCFRNFSRSQH